MPGSHRCPPDRPAAAGRLVVSFCSPASFAADVAFDGATEVYPQGVAVQPDGKVVLSVTVDGVSGLVRFDANGTLDDTFGVDGRTFNTLGVTNSSVAVVARPDGRLVGVAATGGNFAASVYTADGTPDVATALGYDALNRLQTFSRGTLAVGSGGTPTGLSDVTRTQGWNLDTLGNWSKSTTDGATSTRTHNSQNQITGGVGGTIAYDAAGNTTQDGGGLTMTYDAWNRLASAAGPGGTLDIGTNDLIIPNADLDTVHKLVANGRHGNASNGRGKWDGVGITSSAVATNNTAASTERYAIGVIRNGDLLTNKYTTFDGQAVNDDSILVKYTYAGDANLDGVVNATDAGYYVLGGHGWLQGDFDYDGTANAADVSLRTANVGQAALTSPSVNVSTVSGTVTRGQTTTLATAYRTVVDVPSLSVSPGATLDLGTSDLIVRGGSRSAVESAIIAAYDNGAWTGTGITSSAAAASGGSMTLGVAEVGTGAGQLNVTTFDGVAVSAGDVVVRYTLVGDVDLDGRVTQADLDVVLANFGALPDPGDPQWAIGDIDYSGCPEGGDLSLLFDHFNQSAPGAGARYQPGSITVTTGTVNVPLPSSVVATVTDLDLSPQADEAYAYDATGRRTAEDNTAAFGGDRNDLYYSNAWQVLEERKGSRVVSQTVWSTVYVDQPVERDRDADDDVLTGTWGKGGATTGLDERLYTLGDANVNTTAVVGKTSSTTWGVVERDEYDPYRRSYVLNPDGTPRAGSAFAVDVQSQGQRESRVTGTIDSRNRVYLLTLGRFGQADPLGYVDGLNIYQFVRSNPLTLHDPLGLQAAATRPSTQATTRPASGCPDDCCGEYVDSIISGVEKYTATTKDRRLSIHGWELGKVVARIGMPIHSANKRKARAWLVGEIDPGPSHPNGFCNFKITLIDGGQNMDVYAHVTGAMALALYQDEESYHSALSIDYEEHKDALKNGSPLAFVAQKRAEVEGDQVGWLTGQIIGEWFEGKTKGNRSIAKLRSDLKELLCEKITR